MSFTDNSTSSSGTRSLRDNQGDASVGQHMEQAAKAARGALQSEATDSRSRAGSTQVFTLFGQANETPVVPARSGDTSTSEKSSVRAADTVTGKQDSPVATRHLDAQKDANTPISQLIADGVLKDAQKPGKETNSDTKVNFFGKVEAPVLRDVYDNKDGVPSPKPDFVVKANGEIEVRNNPQTNLKGEIVVKFDGDQQHQTPEQQAAGAQLKTYLNHWIKDKYHQVAQTSLDQGNSAYSPSSASRGPGQSDGGDGGGQGSGSGGAGGSGDCSGGDCSGGGSGGSGGGATDGGGGAGRPRGGSSARASADQSPEGPSSQPYSGDGAQPTRDVSAASDSGGNSGGRTESLYDALSSILGADILGELGDPPDYSKLEALMAKLAKDHKIPQGFADKFKDKKFAADFGQFLKNMKSGQGKITAADAEKFLPKELQSSLKEHLAKTNTKPDAKADAKPDANADAAVRNAEKHVAKADVSHKMESIAQEARETANRLGSIGKCLPGVRDTLEAQGVPIKTHGSAYMVAGELRHDPRFQEIGYNQAKDMPGAVLVFGPKRNPNLPNARHGHVTISLGNGREASDHEQGLHPEKYQWATGFKLKSDLDEQVGVG